MKTIREQNKKIRIMTFVSIIGLFLILGILLLYSKAVDAQDFNIRGRLHMDAFYGFHAADDFSNGFNNRRARMGMTGKMTENWDGIIEVDFADAGIAPNDFRLRRSFEHGGRLAFGQFKVPQGLNQLTSSNSITFIERSMVNNIIPDARRIGVSYTYYKGIGGIETMVFGRALGQRASIESGNDMPLGAAFRGVLAPEISEGSRLHFGASVVYEDFNSNRGVGFSDRPESRDSKGGSVRYIRVNVPDAMSTFKAGVELLYINGPFSIEGEFLHVTVNTESGNTPSFFGYHAQIGYVLTGETRSYRGGGVGTISPAKESGAWEIAARYSFMDLNNDIYTGGGEQGNITIALNRYVTSRLRFMANLIIVDTDKTDDTPILGVMRAQYNF